MVVLVTLVICGNLESSEGCSQSVGAVSSVICGAVKRSIGSTIGFHNHREGPYQGLLLIEST